MATRPSTEQINIIIPSAPRWQYLNSPVEEHFPIVGIGKNVYVNPAYQPTNPNSPNYLEYTYLDTATINLMKNYGVNILMCTVPYQKAVNPSEPTDASFPVGLEEHLKNCYLSAANCAKAGIKYLMGIGTPRIDTTIISANGTLTAKGQQEFTYWKEHWKNVVIEFYNYESVAGWMFWDEPSANLFTHIRDYAWNSVKNRDPWNKLRLINLYPSVGKDYVETLFGPGVVTGDFTQWSAYTKYTKDFGSTFGPQVFCFDEYPFHRIYTISKTSTIGKNIANGTNLFPDLSGMSYSLNFNLPFIGMLDTFRYRTKERNNTFWITIPTMMTQRKPESGSAYKISILGMPELAHWKLMVNCALAYGAQGFCYWSMVVRGNNENEHYLDAPIVPQANGTLEEKNTYYKLKNVSDLIRRWEKVFLNCDSRYCAPSAPKNDIDKMGGDVKPFDFKHMFSLVNSCKYGNKGFLVSMIRNQGNNYVVFVNLNYSASQTLTVNFKYDVVDMDDVYKTTEQLGWQTASIKRWNSDNDHVFNVDASEMKVFRVYDSLQSI